MALAVHKPRFRNRPPGQRAKQTPQAHLDPRFQEEAARFSCVTISGADGLVNAAVYSSSPRAGPQQAPRRALTFPSVDKSDSSSRETRRISLLSSLTCGSLGWPAAPEAARWRVELGSGPDLRVAIDPASVCSPAAASNDRRMAIRRADGRRLMDRWPPQRYVETGSRQVRIPPTPQRGVSEKRRTNESMRAWMRVFLTKRSTRILPLRQSSEDAPERLGVRSTPSPFLSITDSCEMRWISPETHPKHPSSSVWGS